MEDHKSIQIGSIGNYYGCLEVKVENGTPVWFISNWDGDLCEPIPQYLYEALMKFESEREQ